MRSIKGILVKVDTENGNATTFEKYDLPYEDYTAFYKALDIDTFDIVRRKFGGKAFDIVCDDNGLFVENKVPAVATIDNGKIVEVIFGNVFICATDDDGESVSISEEDQALILRNVGFLTNQETGLSSKVLSASI